jgi:hypothetical protein
MAFTTKLSEEELAFFNEVCNKPFDQQATAFLNAYWKEIGDQAEFIFEVAYDMIQYADMHAKGVQYIHLYEVGVELEFNIGLYFYEQLCKYLGDSKNKAWTDPKWASSQPEMMTAIKRKQELRDKVDVNFDNKITFLEYLLYQYRNVEGVDPAQFIKRSQAAPAEHPEVTAAREALEEVTKRIKAYEAEKSRLEDMSENGTGIKKMKAKNELAQLESGPLKEALNTGLIQAEAKVRKVVKMFGAGSSTDASDAMPSQGSSWWMEYDLAQKKKKYGRK